MNRISRFIKPVLSVIIIVGTIAVYLHRDNYDVAEMTHWIQGNKLAAPLVFVLLYVVLACLFFPSPILSLSGGVLFGPLTGSMLSMAGATLSAMTAFTIGRYLAADWLERHLSDELRELKHGVDKKGWRFVLMLRIVPGLPFTLFNYALGLTRIRLLHFAAVTSLCILPRVIFLSYAGYTGTRVLAGKQIGLLPLIVLITLGALLTTAYLFRRLRKNGL